VPRLETDYTVAAGQVVILPFTPLTYPGAEPSFGIDFTPADTTPGLTFKNYGRIEFVTDAPGTDLNLLYTRSGTFNGIVWENHGTLLVRASQGGARGYHGATHQAFINTGSLTVEGKMFSLGYSTYGAGNFLIVDNSGQIVTHGGQSKALYVHNHNSVRNSGLISATSDPATTAFAGWAYGVTLYTGGALTNTGRIEAKNRGPAQEATGVYHNAAPLDFTNAGEVVAYEAFYSDAASSIRITNSGLLDGLVVMGSAADRLTNSGRITGQVSLGAGADIYDGVSAKLGAKVDGGAGADTLNGGAMADSLSGGGDRDSVFGGQGADTIDGGEGVDYLRGDDGADSIAGGLNFDDINGNMGADTAAGGAGDDWVVGGKDDDLLSGDADNDIVYGNIGNDTCDGGDGADLVRGGQGDDQLTGRAGSDWLSGDRGNDTMTGGAGADIFHSFGEAEVDRVTDFNPGEGDRVLFDAGTTYTLRESGGDTIVEMSGGGRLILVGVRMASLPTDWASGVAGPSQEPPPAAKPVNTINGEDFTDDDIVGTAGQDSIVGRSGDDNLRGGEEADTLDGGAGNDLLTGDGGADVLIGGDGGDVLNLLFNNAQGIGGAGDDTFFLRSPSVGEPVRLSRIDAGAGYDSVHVRYWQPGQRLVIDGGDDIDQVGANLLGTSQPVNVYLNHDPGGAGIIGLSVEIAYIDIGAIFGSDADESMTVKAGTAEGRGGNDKLYANSSHGGASTLSGGAGDDMLYAGIGDDSLTGGAGADTLSAGGGADTLSGGAGADRFGIGTGFGLDRVVDFNGAEGDRVAVAGSYTLRQDGADTVVDLGAGDRMILVGVQMSSLTPGWIFGT